MKKTAIIVAGGKGLRMGGELPKQFLTLDGNAKPILGLTLDRFLLFDEDLEIVVVLHPDTFDLFDKRVASLLNESEKVRIHLCAGGAERCHSVHAGLKILGELSGNTAQTLVAIHDGVRPFVRNESIAASFALAQKCGAAVCCVPLKSSLRKKTEAGSQAVDRSQFFEVQTPQTFVLSQIIKAYDDRPHDLFTDDASLIEAAGCLVELCQGSYDNIKLTTADDLLMGSLLLGIKNKDKKLK